MKAQTPSQQKAPYPQSASTTAQVRVISTKSIYTAPQSILTTEPATAGTWILDPTDTTTPDNGGTVLVTTGGLRYKRVCESINPRWFFTSVKGNGDYRKAMQEAVNEQVRTGKPIVVPAGVYTISGTITKPASFTGLTIRATPGTVVFNYSAAPEGTACFNIVGGSGKMCMSIIEGITFRGNGASIGISIDGQNGQLVQNCVFQNNLVGIRFFNNSPGSFTEWCTGEKCKFENTCRYATQYKRGKGNVSFHGSGLIGVNYVTAYAPGEGAVALVDDNCLPYNAPLNVQVWFTKSSSLIINNNTGTYYPYFVGTISFEQFSNGVMTLGDGPRQTYFSGNIDVFGDNVQRGRLVRCESVLVKDNGSTIPQGVRVNDAHTLGNTVTVLNPDFQGGIYQVTYTAVGPNYDYRGILIYDSSGGGNNAGSVTSLATTRTFNTSGWGPPSFDVDNHGRLTITNPKYPTTGQRVQLYTTIQQVSDFIYGNYPQKTF
ncbi:hypothetical protein [uncultured Spirosoma sp.]|uniref:hypothetical protein n=1 Tax=uncultured Spirosoma sp. TaxID=278208 RepID=UPI002590E50B|nr:hypothetical protein [uncultured Spirosoma sp.]